MDLARRHLDGINRMSANHVTAPTRQVGRLQSAIQDAPGFQRRMSR